MRILSLILMVGLSSFSAIGQQLEPFLSGTETGHTIGVFGSGSLASNALRVQFIRDIYTGQALDREMREDQSSAMGNTNRIGGDLNYGIYYRHLPDSLTKGWGWGVKLAARTHTNAQFSKDAYHVAFLGNASYAGQTANFANTEFTLFDYKQFGGGVIKDLPTKTGHFRVGLSAYFLLAQRAAKAQFEEASLFTEEFGEFLDISVKGEFQTSGISDGRYFASNGYGVSVDLFLQMVRPKHTITLEATDLGGLFMSGNTDHVTLDTTARFEGLELDLFGSSEEPFSGLQPDSLSSLFGITESTGDFSIALPFAIHLRSEHKMADGKWFLYGGLQYRFAPYFPLIYAGAKFKLPAKFEVSPTFSYGGYGSWNIGLEIQKKFGNLVTFNLGTNNLEGLIVPSISTGQGAYTSLEFHF